MVDIFIILMAVVLVSLVYILAKRYILSVFSLQNINYLQLKKKSEDELAF